MFNFMKKNFQNFQKEKEANTSLKMLKYSVFSTKLINIENTVKH